MIVQMSRVRVAGPRPLLEPTLGLLQDLGVLHVVRPSAEAAADPVSAREARHLTRMLGDVDEALNLVGDTQDGTAPQLGELRGAARQARRVRRRAAQLTQKRAALEHERVLLLRYREFFAAFAPLVGHEVGWPEGRSFYVVLRAGAADAADRLRDSLETAVGKEIELIARPIASGETAVLLLTSAVAAAKVGQLLQQSRVQELPAPSGLEDTNLLRAMPRLQARLDQLPEEVEGCHRELVLLRQTEAPSLRGARAWLHDRLLVLSAREKVIALEHLFVLEGWLPRRQLAQLTARLATQLGPDVLVEEVATEGFSARDAPVELTNPPLFRPFEVITSMLPLPRYGTIDSTPFVAVFFPMFFGLMLGDIGYGLALAAIAVVLRWRSKPETRLRSIAAIAGACSAFSIAFGFVFGEAFGSLGEHLGLKPLAFDRREAVIPFLLLAVGLGVVHITLGLVLAVVNAWRSGDRRAAAGRGVASAMVVLTVLALLATFQVLPKALLTPVVVTLLVAFTALIALEGVVAVVELVSSFGHILSYARIMALGTASVMLAVVANQMVGAMGSVAVGLVFALLFHLVNFAIGLFSPTLHAVRLHYVEFFTKFFSPGGAAYRPLTHWHLLQKPLTGGTP